VPAQLRAAERGELDVTAMEKELKEAGLDPALAPALADEAREHAERVALEERERDVLHEAGRPTYELPALPEADLGALYVLAGLLRDQGMVP
jgi:hypothetical protein